MRARRRLPLGVFERRGRDGPLFYFGVAHGDRWLRRPSPDNTIGGAVVARQEALARIARGEDPFPERAAARGPLTVGHVLARYVALLKSSPRSETALELACRRAEAISERIGSVAVAALDEAALLAYRDLRDSEWRAKKKRGLRVATVNRELEFLRAALNSAKDGGLVSSHIFARLPKSARRRVIPKEVADGPREYRGVEDTDLDALLTELPDAYPRPVRVLFLTGAREAEIFNLRREHVLRDVIRFVRTKGRTVRDFPLTEELRELLGDGSGDLVFADENGRSLLPAFGKAWQRARKRAKRDWFKPHHLRAERASRLLDDGATEAEVRELLGWSDNSPVPRRYIRPSRLRLRALVEKTSARREVAGRVLRFEAGDSSHESSHLTGRP